MTKFRVVLCTLLMFGLTGTNAFADIQLADWCLNINGTATCNNSSLPSQVDGSGFDFAAWPNTLGSLTVTLGNHVGPQFVMLYVDYDVSFSGFGSFDDSGTVVGLLPPGVTYEIGDLLLGSAIRDDVALSTTGVLPNTGLGNSQSFPQDVALALAVAVPDTGGVVTFTANTGDAQGFHLLQQNLDTQEALSLFLGPGNPQPQVVPEPASLMLLASGVAVLLAARRLRRI